MCGIAGILSRDQSMVRKALPPMVQAQVHRGPDDSGEKYVSLGDRFLGLGHRRLAILDLTSSGHQPMEHQPSGSSLIFNGEIYNHQQLREELAARGERFDGHCDTEVLLRGLARDGTDFIPRLCGMYAFIYLDLPSRRLIVARDPMGIKPLYVAAAAHSILVASEVRAILACGAVSRDIDRQGLEGLLAYGAVQEPHTLFASIQAFPAGCWAEVSEATGWTLRKHRFWSFPERNAGITSEQAVSQVQHLADQAVRDHLVADVPVGVFLSSGLDSTIIAALAARHAPKIHTFTVGFHDHPDASELQLAAETAQILGTPHEQIMIDGAEAKRACHEWLDVLDQPSVDGLNTFVISQAVRAQGIKVALSGLGGDELFGGYSSFRDVPRLARILRPAQLVPVPLRVSAARVMSVGRSVAFREKLRDFASLSGDTRELYLTRRRVMSNAQLAALGLPAAVNGKHRNDGNDDGMLGFPGDPIYELSQFESRLYMGNTLLRDSDVNSMRHSLELRLPMLDQRLVDAVAGIPGHVRLPSGAADKHLLRTAFAKHLRPAVLRQPKRGFALPINHWMATEFRDLCEASLSHLKSSGLLTSPGIDQIWAAYLHQPESQMWSRAFTLCVLGIYLRRIQEPSNAR